MSYDAVFGYIVGYRNEDKDFVFLSATLGDTKKSAIEALQTQYGYWEPWELLQKSGFECRKIKLDFCEWKYSNKAHKEKVEV